MPRKSKANPIKIIVEDPVVTENDLQIENLESKLEQVRKEEFLIKREAKVQTRKILIISIILVSIILISGITTIIYLVNNQKQTVETTETTTSPSSSKDQSSSQTNSQSNQASSKDQSSSSLSSVSSSSSRSPTPELKTYSNQYYPSLKIVYDETWKFETATGQTIYTNVVDRVITLEKNGTKMSFFITPKFIAGCGPYENPKVNKSQNLNLKDGKIDRYQLTTTPQTYFYQKKGLSENIDDDCPLSPLILNSNLVSEEYTRFFPDEKFIVSMVRINIQGNDPQAISEADKIIEQSTFFDVVF